MRFPKRGRIKEPKIKEPSKILVPNNPKIEGSLGWNCLGPQMSKGSNFKEKNWKRENAKKRTLT